MYSRGGDFNVQPPRPGQATCNLVPLTSSMAVLVGHEKLLVVGQLEAALNCHGSEKDVGLVLFNVGDLLVLQLLGELGDGDVLPVAAIAGPANGVVE